MEILAELPSPVAQTMLESLGVPQVLKDAGVTMSIFKSSQTVIVGTPKIGRGARLGPKAVVIGDAVIGANAIIESSLVLPGATIAAKEEIFGEIISREEAVAVVTDDDEDDG
jgi:NDP-sugar pyrophosphorylase family protein